MTKQEAINVLEKYTTKDVGISKIVIAAHEMAIAALKNQTWVPVADRFPKNNESVLITTTDGDVDTDFSRDGKWFWGDEGDYSVVAWMPLPEPYKSEN